LFGLGDIFNWKTLGIIALVAILGLFIYRKMTAPPDMAKEMREMMQQQMQMQMMQKMGSTS